jgi:hypothetical protein
MNTNGIWFFVEYLITIGLYLLYPVYLKSIKKAVIDPNSVWKIALINSLVVGGLILGARYLINKQWLFDTRPILFYVVNSMVLKFEGKKAEFTLKEDPSEEDSPQ